MRAEYNQPLGKNHFAQCQKLSIFDKKQGPFSLLKIYIYIYMLIYKLLNFQYFKIINFNKKIIINFWSKSHSCSHIDNHDSKLKFLTFER